MPRQLTPEALQAAADTTGAQAAGTTTADTSAISQFGEDISEATRYLLTGEWDQLWFNIYGGAVDFAVYYVPKLVGALLVFVVLYALYRVLANLLERVLHHSRRVEPGLRSLLMKSYRVVAILFIGTIVLDQLEFNVTALVASLSIAGIALAFAARDSLENFISGVIILIDRPFRVGDNIEVDDTFGTVEEITLRSTRVCTLNNEIVVMPNTSMIDQRLINHTMLNTLRVEIYFGIGYDESPQEAREVLLAMAEGDERLHPDHPTTVVVTEMGASSVNMILRLYLRNPKLEVPFRYEYNEKVRNALTEAGIEIPFPHLQLHIDEAKAFEGSALLQPPPNGHSRDAAE